MNKKELLKNKSKNAFESLIRKHKILKSFQKKLDRENKTEIIFECEPNNDPFIRQFFLKMDRKYTYSIEKKNRRLSLKILIDKNFITFYNHLNSTI